MGWLNISSHKTKIATFSQKKDEKVEVKNSFVMIAFNKNSWKNPVCKLLQKNKAQIWDLETELLSTRQKDLKWTKDATDVSHRPIMFCTLGPLPSATQV